MDAFDDRLDDFIQRVGLESIFALVPEHSIAWQPTDRYSRVGVHWRNVFLANFSGVKVCVEFVSPLRGLGRMGIDIPRLTPGATCYRPFGAW